MDLYEARPLADLDIENELKPWVFDGERLDCVNHIDLIENWNDVYSWDEQIKSIFYDDLRENPRTVLEEICGFVGLDISLLSSSKDDSKKVNSNCKKAFRPEAVKGELIELYRPQVDFLERRFNRDFSKWLM